MLFCSGGLRVDTVITAVGEARMREMGGNALYAAVGAKLWRPDIGIVGRIGVNFPTTWRDLWRERGFDVRGVVSVNGAQDHRTFYAYIDHNTRDDTHPEQHFARIGALMPDDLIGYEHSCLSQENPEEYEPLAPRPEDLPISIEALHLSPQSLKSQLTLPSEARRRGAKLISADPGERFMTPALMPYVEKLLSLVDVFMPSLQEVNTLFGFPLDAQQPFEKLIEFAQWFAARGPRIVVLKIGSGGSLIYQRDTHICVHIPSLKVNVVDVTGAGDSYCGGFIAHFSKCDNPVLAGMAGTVAASFNIEDYGAMHLLNADMQIAQQRFEILKPQVKEYEFN